MLEQQISPTLSGETLISLRDAAANFGGVAIPLRTVRNYVYKGVRGLKLESVSINGRYTSKEAIQRFLERKQIPVRSELPVTKKMTQDEVLAGLKRHGLVQ